jgi:hypothetical protein
MEIIEAIGKPAEYVVANNRSFRFIWASIMYLPIGYHWVLSWTFINRDELFRLKDSEIELERLRKLDSPIAREIKAQLERQERKEPIVNTA